MGRPIINPDIKACIPALSAEELSGLRANLKSEGCRDPLVVWRGRNILLDGHNRLSICEELGISYRTVEIEIKDIDAAKAWAIRNQFSRRNLSPTVRAELALKLKPLLAAEAEKSRRAAGDANLTQNTKSSDPTAFLANGSVVMNSSTPARRVRASLSKEAGVSEQTVAKVEKILDRAAPEIADMARRNEISVNAAEKVSRLPVSEQKKAATAGPKGVNAAAKSVDAPPAPEPVDSLNHPLPANPAMREAFGQRQKMLALVNRLTQIKKEVRALGGSATFFLRVQRFEADLSNARTELNAAIPYSLCAYCRGTGKYRGADCTGCQRQGWSTKAAFEQSPPEMRQALLATAGKAGAA